MLQNPIFRTTISAVSWVAEEIVKEKSDQNTTPSLQSAAMALGTKGSRA